MSEIKTETKLTGFRKALSDIEKRHELIYGMAINAYNTCLVLEMTNMEELIDLKFRLRFFEEAALSFYTDDDTDKQFIL